jgi:hypothetical protein
MPETTTANRAVTPAEFAALMHVSVRTVHAMIAKGTVRAREITPGSKQPRYRIMPAEVRRWGLEPVPIDDSPKGHR